MRWVVDLEGTPQPRSFVAHVLQERSVIGRSATDEIHRVAIGGTELDVLAALEEGGAQGLGDGKVEGLHGGLARGGLLGGGDGDEGGLVWGTGEVAVEIAEVVPAGWAGGDDGFDLLEVGAEGGDLVGGAAYGTLCEVGAASGGEEGFEVVVCGLSGGWSGGCARRGTMTTDLLGWTVVRARELWSEATFATTGSTYGALAVGHGDDGD